MLQLLLITLSLLTTFISTAPTSPNPRISTRYGTFIGKNEKSVDTWYQIPYGQAPVGNLRFASPVKNTKEYGLFDSTVSFVVR